jgi:hypothetical protein
MNKQKFSLSLGLAALLFLLPICVTSAAPQNSQNQNQDQIQNQATALMRGYRAGYSDGYPAGVTDAAKQAGRDFRQKAEYQQGDRAYSSTFGSLDEYRNGYQQGFEVGYNDGYDRKNFDSTIPTDLKVRDESDANSAPPSTTPSGNVGSTGSLIVVSRDTVMRVELLSNLSTDASQKGDRFEARVLEPKEYEGATVQGEVTRVKRPGRVKGTAELQLSFDRIQLADGRSAKISAQVIELMQTGTSQGVGKVDPEGGVQGKDSTKGDVTKVGAATGIGAAIGAIFGGGSGAAVGATIGAGIGTAGVLRERGKDIYLYRGQQMRIRTAGNAEIQ